MKHDDPNLMAHQKRDPLSFEPEFELHGLVQQLTDSENQPHQYLGSPTLLKAALYKAFRPITADLLDTAIKRSSERSRPE